MTTHAQDLFTPEQLWKLGRVTGKGISKDGKFVVYTVGVPDMAENVMNTKAYVVPINGGTAVLVINIDSVMANDKISPDGLYKISSEEVKVKDVIGTDFYPDLKKSNVLIYDQLNYRHWDTWEDGKFGHVMLTPILNGKPGEPKDIMAGEPYHCRPYCR